MPSPANLAGKGSWRLRVKSTWGSRKIRADNWCRSWVAIASNTLLQPCRTGPREDALETEVQAQSEDALRFIVTRCRYAEMYDALGLRELGAILSCERDGALIKGFNSDIGLDRPQTILGGASHCIFHYVRRRDVPAEIDERHTFSQSWAVRP